MYNIHASCHNAGLLCSKLCWHLYEIHLLINKTKKKDQQYICGVSDMAVIHRVQQLYIIISSDISSLVSMKD